MTSDSPPDETSAPLDTAIFEELHNFEMAMNAHNRASTAVDDWVDRLIEDRVSSNAPVARGQQMVEVANWALSSLTPVVMARALAVFMIREADKREGERSGDTTG